MCHWCVCSRSAGSRCAMSTSAGACCSLRANVCTEMSVETGGCHFQSVSDWLFTHLCMSLNVWVNSKRHVFSLSFQPGTLNQPRYVGQIHLIDVCHETSNLLFEEMLPLSTSEESAPFILSFFPLYPHSAPKGLIMLIDHWIPCKLLVLAC